jgi:NAD(P)-dependent dehydrogenase (short-subunit alcohol dehydrogenase family)
MKLLGKVAVVTGAGAGNGKAIAFGFAKEGAKIAVLDIDEKAGRETAKEINGMGRDAIFLLGDVSDSKDVSKAVQATMDRFGRIDILVNNAGILSRVHFLELTEEEWDRVLRVNLRGTFVCSQKVANEMKKEGKGGVIINISSISGEVARPNTAAYVASKGAVKMLTKAMAVDLAQHKIRVNAIAPGYVRTAMTEKIFQDQAYLNKLLDRIPLGYIASPEDLVGPAVFLASEESRYITGTILFVDGGWLTL